MTAGVFVLGGWQSDFAERAGDGGLYGLLEAAVRGSLAEARLDAGDVDVAHIGNLAGELTCFQAQLGGLLVSIDPGLIGLPTTRHEAACASGSVAVLAAMADLEAGRYDVALVAGVEVLRNVGSQRAAELLSCAGWSGRDTSEGDNLWPRAFAELATEYERRYGLNHSPLGTIAEINLANARRNPNAQTRAWDIPTGAFGTDDGLNPPVEGILRRWDCGRITDGSVAVVLASDRYVTEYARRRNLDPGALPRIKGWGHSTAPTLLRDKLAIGRGGPYVLPHLRQTMLDALRRAELPDVYALDVLEVHDCFSIVEYAALDHFGLAEPGQTWQAVESGIIAADGKLPVNPSGGLLGGGHPVGASGVRMVLDCAKQVTGRAGGYQVPGARNAGSCNVGGSATTVVNFVVGVDATIT